jgi:hypothetical protein
MAKKETAKAPVIDKGEIKHQLQELRASFDVKRREAEAKLIEPYQQQLDELKSERNDIEARIWEIEKVIAEVTGRDIDKPAASGKRVRKSPTELAEQAQAVVTFVRTKGAGGATAGEIAEKCGKLSLSPAAFVKKFANITLKKTGERATAKYSI